MYLIINKSKNTRINIEGDFPSELVEALLDNGHDIIIVSTYSCTIKVPYWDEEMSEWNYKEYSYANPDNPLIN